MYFRIYGNKSIQGKAHALATFIVTQIAGQSEIFQLPLPDYRAWLYSKVYNHPRIINLSQDDVFRMIPTEEVDVNEGTDIRTLIDEVIFDVHERINGIGGRKVRQEVMASPVGIFHYLAFSDAMADVAADTPELGIGPSRALQDMQETMGIDMVSVNDTSNVIYSMMPGEMLTASGLDATTVADQAGQMKQLIALLYRFGEEAKEEARQVSRNYHGRRECRADQRDQHRYDTGWLPRKTMGEKLDATIEILHDLIAVVPAGERTREINELYNEISVLRRSR